MPPQLGEIISESVYEGRLQSDPSHPVTNKTPACYFINVPEGKEKQFEKSYIVCFCFPFSTLIKLIEFRMSLSVKPF